MSQLEKFRYHFSDDPQADGAPPGPESVRGLDAPEDAERRSFNSAESAARFYLAEKLAQEEAPALREAVREDRPERVPDLALSTESHQAGTGTTLVRFEQTQQEIPVFGAEVLVELDENQRLVSMDGRLGEVTGVGSVPELSGTEALERVKTATGSAVSAEELPPPTLTYVSRDDQWHLAWHLREVPAQLPSNRREEGQRGHGLGASPREAFPLTGYLVDAYSGEILKSYGMTPTITVPTRLEGEDEVSVRHRFQGSRLDGSFLLHDQWREIVTYDLDFADIASTGTPTSAISSPQADFGAGHRAGVSAHVNAERVESFYRDQLHRNGIDDADMDLVSLVNCTYNEDGPGPEWFNAVWWKSRMWYGQVSDGNRLVSLARHFVIIAHEMTHGVIETSSNLVYQDQSGALNESLADTMGVIIANWYQAPDREDVDTWNWEIGAGLGDGGLPLRDMSDPTRTGDPDHMRDFLHTTRDNGGVHTNSNIHNKAMFRLLTSVDAAGNPVLTVAEWALLIYLALVRLLRESDFPDMHQALRDVTNTYLSGNAALRTAAQAAIDQAYQQVGIPIA
ncbi:M4 family metallopeptidase [Streptomyces sp. P9(2023)]|uniref:M4 family metallopeptidase n=1 Tax=Streptomyces sp. P9(2023) TaxID=3064394 RepID=UPI0028F426DC|nr:M4 family metallopeptidase [Streptomyces sp. P9(2023)]MDT9686937.1 M4 family metallopeptidase [Streptomyces sp. P9(2023)]